MTRGARHGPAPARRTLEVLARHGLACERVTGAGSGVYTEVQAGSYIFMDADYAQNLGPDGQPWSECEQSLFVWATVMSRPTRERAVLDAGLPRVLGMPDVEYVRPSDEHGKLALRDPGRALDVGTKLRLIPGHCDSTVNLYDWFVGYRADRVETIWPIAARGAEY